MSTPLVSVAIPTYNQPALLCQAIDSVLQQTMTDYEIVVVNDGSTDDTLKHLDPYGQRIRIIDQANAGIGAARNRGIDESRGKYIALLDHDDWWMPEKLAVQVAFMEAHPQCVACAVPYASSREPDRPAAWPDQVSGADRIVVDPFTHLAAAKLFIGTSALMLDRKKSAGIRYGTTRETMEDVEFMIKLLARGPFGMAGEHVMAIWRAHAANSSSQPRYDYHGVSLLRAMLSRGHFDELPLSLRPSLLGYLGQLGRTTATGQILKGQRLRGMQLYLNELIPQLRLGRALDFYLGFP